MKCKNPFVDKKRDKVFESEYNSGYHARNVTNSENHPRIEEKNDDPVSPLRENEVAQTKDNVVQNGSVLLEAYVRLQPIKWKDGVVAPGAVKKKKRSTEQEKLIASLCEGELGHVDGAFKRSATMQYKNLNEDTLLDGLFHGCRGVKLPAVKKKRKTEKEKLIDSLSEIEKIHAEGAFKRGAVLPVPFKGYATLDKVTQLSDAT